MCLKFIARTNKLDNIFSKQYKEFFEEEFFGLIEYIQTNYTKESFKEISEQERLKICREYYKIGRAHV